MHLTKRPNCVVTSKMPTHFSSKSPHTPSRHTGLVALFPVWQLHFTERTWRGWRSWHWRGVGWKWVRWQPLLLPWDLDWLSVSVKVWRLPKNWPERQGKRGKVGGKEGRREEGERRKGGKEGKNRVRGGGRVRRVTIISRLSSYSFLCCAASHWYQYTTWRLMHWHQE